jgi:hypothetical protein
MSGEKWRIIYKKNERRKRKHFTGTNSSLLLLDTLSIHSEHGHYSGWMVKTTNLVVWQFIKDRLLFHPAILQLY